MIYNFSNLQNIFDPDAYFEEYMYYVKRKLIVFSSALLLSKMTLLQKDEEPVLVHRQIKQNHQVMIQGLKVLYFGLTYQQKENQMKKQIK